MPNFDRTGPMGQGPLTGKGLGLCGLGLKRGWGRGFGFRRFFSLSKEEKKKILEDEMKILEEELNAIKKELEEN